MKLPTPDWAVWQLEFSIYKFHANIAPKWGFQYIDIIRFYLRLATCTAILPKHVNTPDQICHRRI
jgi:hypothetical protein